MDAINFYQGCSTSYILLYQRKYLLRSNYKASKHKFFNVFASYARISPVLPLIGGGKTKFAPIYCGDVGKAIVKALELKNIEPKIYELDGPDNYSFKELM